VAYVWCEIRQQSFEEPCDEHFSGKTSQVFSLKRKALTGAKIRTSLKILANPQRLLSSFLSSRLILPGSTHTMVKMRMKEASRYLKLTQSNRHRNQRGNTPDNFSWDLANPSASFDPFSKYTESFAKYPSQFGCFQK